MLSSPLNRLLLLICVSLAIVFTALWLLPVNDDLLPATADPVSGATAIAIANTAPVPATDNLMGHPLFDQNRQGVSQAPAVAAAPAPVDLYLVGIIAGSEGRVAIFRDPASTTGKDQVRAREGDTLANWTIRRITADHVVVETAGARQELRVQYP